MLCKRCRFQPDDENDNAEVHHCALSEGKTAASQYDVVFCAQNFTNMFKDAEKKGTIVIGLRNIMSQQEMEDKMREKGIIA